MNLSHWFHGAGRLPINVQLFLALAAIVALCGAAKLADRSLRRRRDAARDERLAREIRAARRDQHMARIKRLPDETVSRIVAGMEIQVAGCDDAPPAEPEPDPAPLAEHGPMPRRVPAHVPEEVLPEPEPEFTDLFAEPSAHDFQQTVEDLDVWRRRRPGGPGGAQ